MANDLKFRTGLDLIMRNVDEQQRNPSVYFSVDTDAVILFDPYDIRMCKKSTTAGLVNYFLHLQSTVLHCVLCFM